MISIMGTTNGMNTLVDEGTTHCRGGFGKAVNVVTDSCRPLGTLEYQSSLSAADAINELDLLLTGGRLSEENKAFILDRYTQTLVSNPENAMKIAQQLILSSPEFHTTNIVRKTSGERQASQASGSTTEPYKAVINLYLFGGIDSFYMLSPYHDCGPLYTEYEAIRGEFAKLKDEQMLELNAMSSEQPCERFGLHNNLPEMKAMYDDEIGLFLANTGRKYHAIMIFYHAFDCQSLLIMPF